MFLRSESKDPAAIHATNEFGKSVGGVRRYRPPGAGDG